MRQLDQEMRKELRTWDSLRFLDTLASLKKKGKNDLFNQVVINRCADNLEDFARLFLGDIANLPPNPIHRDLYQTRELGERGVSVVCAAPRGSGKSVVIALIEALHDVCYHTEHYILLVSSTADQSVQKLKDIRHELLENELLISVYGGFFGSNRVSAGNFIATNGDHRCLFEAAGSTKEVRGKRFGPHRVTKLILDDYESDEEVESEACREKSKNLFNESFSKLGSPTTNTKIVGTVLHREALLNDLLKTPGFKSSFYKSIIEFSPRQDLWDRWKKIYTNLDNDNALKESEEFFQANKTEMLKGTKVLWPEKEDYLFLQKEIIKFGWRAFSKERQNMPMSSDEKVFDMENAHYYTDYGDHVVLSKTGLKVPKKDARWVGVIDPSTGEKKPNLRTKGDFTCILSAWLDDKGRIFVDHCFIRRVPPSAFIEKILDYNDQYRYTKFGVEINLYRNLLTQSIKEALKKRNESRRRPVTLRMREINQTEKKERRVYRVEPKVDNGWIVFNKNLPQEFFGQMQDFPKGDHDDGPDALEMLWTMCHADHPIKAVHL